MAEQTDFSASGEAHGESSVLTGSCGLSVALCNSSASQKRARAPPAGFYGKYDSKLHYSESLIVYFTTN